MFRAMCEDPDESAEDDKTTPLRTFRTGADLPLLVLPDDRPDERSHDDARDDGPEPSVDE